MNVYRCISGFLLGVTGFLGFDIPLDDLEHHASGEFPDSIFLHPADVRCGQFCSVAGRGDDVLWRKSRCDLQVEHGHGEFVPNRLRSRFLQLLRLGHFMWHSRVGPWFMLPKHNPRFLSRYCGRRGIARRCPIPLGHRAGRARVLSLRARSAATKASARPMAWACSG